MIKMLAYVSIPYAMNNRDSQRIAILKLNKFIGQFVRQNPNWYAVNALFNEYGNVNIEDAIYAQANCLIRASDVVMVLKEPGWEYDHILNNEAGFAAAIGKPVQFMVHA